jgi:hypothetical protein
MEQQESTTFLITHRYTVTFDWEKMEDHLERYGLVDPREKEEEQERVRRIARSLLRRSDIVLAIARNTVLSGYTFGYSQGDEQSLVSILKEHLDTFESLDQEWLRNLHPDVADEILMPLFVACVATPSDFFVL